MPSWPRFSSCALKGCSASGEKGNPPAAGGGLCAPARPAPGDRGGDLNLRDLRAGAEPAARLHGPPFLRPGDLLRLGGLRRSEEHTSELQSHLNLVCRLLLEK